MKKEPNINDLFQEYEKKMVNICEKVFDEKLGSCPEECGIEISYGFFNTAKFAYKNNIKNWDNSRESGVLIWSKESGLVRIKHCNDYSCTYPKLKKLICQHGDTFLEKLEGTLQRGIDRAFAKATEKQNKEEKERMKDEKKKLKIEKQNKVCEANLKKYLGD